jgi:hypothetical protein
VKRKELEKSFAREQPKKRYVQQMEKIRKQKTKELVLKLCDKAKQKVDVDWEKEGKSETL